MSNKVKEAAKARMMGEIGAEQESETEAVFQNAPGALHGHQRWPQMQLGAAASAKHGRNTPVEKIKSKSHETLAKRLTSLLMSNLCF